MDLLGEHPLFDLHGKGKRILYRNTARAPQFVGESAHIENSLISEGCEIYGNIEDSVIFSGVTVEEGAPVKNSVILSDCTIKEGSRVEYAIIDSDTRVGRMCVIGDSVESGK